jgi:hypothetical protein
MHNKFSVFAAGLLMAGALMGPAAAIADNELNRPDQDTPADGRGNRSRQQPAPAATGGAVVSGNGINYHNGPVMKGVSIYYIWYGDWSTDTGANAILTDFANTIGGSPYFAIDTTYGDTSGNVPNVVTHVKDYIDTGSLGTSLTDANILTLVSNALGSGKLGPTDPNGVYFVLTAPGVAETSGFLTSYCGWHTRAGLNGVDVKYAFVGNAKGPSLGSCSVQTGGSPNGDPSADAMVNVVAHELEEAASDPDLNAWYDASGMENADKCAWNFGTTYSTGNGSLANMKLGTRDFLIQQNWLNAGGGGCALSYAVAPDFSVAVSPSPQTVTPGGVTGNYTASAVPLNGWSKTVTWTVAPPAGITATPSSSSGTFALSASSSVAAGTYSVNVTGTDGTNTHTSTASVVVSSPTFSISVSPSSQSVRRPTSGSASAAYTVTVTPGAGFTSNVALTVSGGATGLTLSPSPATITGGTGTSILTATVTPSARRSTRTLTVTGSGGGVTKSASATIAIQ